MEEVDDKEFEELDTESEDFVDEKEFEEAAVDARGTDEQTDRQRSRVYTATTDTLFQEAATDRGTHSLVGSLEFLANGMYVSWPSVSHQH